MVGTRNDGDQKVNTRVRPKIDHFVPCVHVLVHRRVELTMSGVVEKIWNGLRGHLRVRVAEPLDLSFLYDRASTASDSSWGSPVSPAPKA